MQPALEGARLVVRQRAEDADEGLLGQVLGIVLISRQTIGEPVDTIGVLTYQFVPRRHQTRAARGVEARGAGRNPVGGLVSRTLILAMQTLLVHVPSFTLVVRPGYRINRSGARSIPARPVSPDSRIPESPFALIRDGSTLSYRRVVAVHEMAVCP